VTRRETEREKERDGAKRPRTLIGRQPNRSQTSIQIPPNRRGWVQGEYRSYRAGRARAAHRVNGQTRRVYGVCKVTHWAGDNNIQRVAHVDVYTRAQRLSFRSCTRDVLVLHVTCCTALKPSTAWRLWARGIRPSERRKL
jgi:hypothetical protein